MNDKLRFGEMLVRAGVLDRADLERVMRSIEDQPVDLGETLVAKGLVNEAEMLQAISKALNRPCVSLERVQPDKRAISLVPRELCVKYFLIPVEVERGKSGEHLHIAMANPSDVRAIKQVTRQARLRIQPLIASGREIRLAIAQHYGGAAPPGPAAPGALPDALAETAMGTPAHQPAPPAAPAPEASGGNGMFDYGVMDLSAYEESTPVPHLEPAASQSSELLGGRYDSSPSLGPGGSHGNRSRTPRAGLGADLVDALENSAHDALMGSSNLNSQTPRQEPADAGGFGVRKPRRRRSGPVKLASSAAPAHQSTPSRRPLPPLPPGLRNRNSGAIESVPPPPSLAADIPPPPGGLAAPPSISAPPSDTQAMQTPAGFVDDREKGDLRGILNRYVSDMEEPDAAGADEVIARYVDRYGQATTPPAADQVFEALGAAVERTGSATAKLLITLIIHLARRGLVDPAELLGDLSDS